MFGFVRFLFGFQSPQYSRAMANMADESSDNIWARKFLTLETRVKQIELVSAVISLFFHVLFFAKCTGIQGDSTPKLKNASFKFLKFAGESKTSEQNLPCKKAFEEV